MKKSNYNIFFTNNNKRYVFNTLNSSLAEIDKCFFDIYDNLDKTFINNPVFLQMKENGFIIDNDINELDSILDRNRALQNELNSLDLTILLTLNCNFRCIYCYQNRTDIKTNEDSLELDEDEFEIYLMKFLDSFRNIEKLRITWFGGEPTLKTSMIIRLSSLIIKFCNKNNIIYQGSIVSNGFLLTDSTVKKLIGNNICDYQVTLDGLKKTHDTRRKHISMKESSFDRIINFLIIARKYDLRVSLRINLDKTNIDEIYRLIDFLQPYYYPNLIINFAKVELFTSFCNIDKDDIFSQKEFAEIEIDLIRYIFNKNMIDNIFEFFPYSVYNYCGATKPNSFVISPKGEVFKCWTDVEVAKPIHNIVLGNKDDFNQYDNIYMKHNVASIPKCINCNLLPICLGGCIYNNNKEQDILCPEIKYNLINLLELYTE